MTHERQFGTIFICMGLASDSHYKEKGKEQHDRENYFIKFGAGQ